MFYQAMETHIADFVFEGHGSDMFWIRIWDLQNGYGDSENHIPQIVGHTPTKEWCPREIKPGKLWCIDTPPVHHRIHGGVAALVTEDDGETFTLHYVE
jgi:hypothetical protein